MGSSFQKATSNERSFHLASLCGAAVLVLACSGTAAAEEDWEKRCPSMPETTELVQCAGVDASSNEGAAARGLDCVLCGLYRCSPTQGLVWHDFGSTRLKVLGKRQERCRVELDVEEEQGHRHYVCELQYPVVPWKAVTSLTPLADAPQAARDGCRLGGRAEPRTTPFGSPGSASTL